MDTRVYCWCTIRTVWPQDLFHRAQERAVSSDHDRSFTVSEVRIYFRGLGPTGHVTSSSAEHNGEFLYRTKIQTNSHSSRDKQQYRHDRKLSCAVRSLAQKIIYADIPSCTTILMCTTLSNEQPAVQQVQYWLLPRKRFRRQMYSVPQGQMVRRHHGTS